jgi:hypothetical protein
MNYVRFFDAVRPQREECWSSGRFARLVRMLATETNINDSSSAAQQATLVELFS